MLCLFAVDREKLDNMRVELLRGMKINELFLSCMQRDGVVKHGQKLDVLTNLFKSDLMTLLFLAGDW